MAGTLPMKQQGVTASVIDRLLGDSDEQRSLPPGQISASDFIASVARDIEQLLNCRNTRKRIDPIEIDFDDASGEGIDEDDEPSPARLLDGSVVMYGLPDFSSLSLANGRHRQALVDAVQNAIETFEPRLTHVRVLLSDDRRASASLQFSIQADLKLANASSAVGFEAWFESMSLHFAVSPPRGRIGA